MSRTKPFKVLANSLFLFTLMGTLFLSTNSRADDLADYIEKGDIKVSLEFENKTAVPREQVVARLLVLSQYPLSEEMLLPYLDVENGVINTDEQGIVRSTKTLDGKRWYTQETRLYIYPLNSGRFTLPSFDIQLVISDKDKLTKGVIKTPVAELKVGPEASSKEYVASKEASLALTGQSTEKLNEGDAVTLVYTLSVNDSHTMLLPELKPAKLSGAERYVKPVQKENLYNRLTKSNTAVLTQEVTYIFPKQGRFVVPAKSIDWWDTQSQSLKTLTLEEQVFTVGSPGIWSSITDIQIKAQWVYALLGVFFIGIATWFLLNRKTFKPVKSKKKKVVPVIVTGKDFTLAISQHDYKKAAFIARDIAERNGVELNSIQLWGRLRARAYGKDSNDDFSHSDAQSLLEQISCKPTSSRKVFRFDWRLNPD